MRFRSGLGVATLGASLVLGAGAEPSAPIPVEAFFGNPTISNPVLSPDGEHIAFVYSKEDYQRVFVRSVAGSKPIGLAEIPVRDTRLRWLGWANSDRVLFSGAAADPKATAVEPLITRLFGVSRERPRLKWLGERWGARGPGWVQRQSRFEDRVVSRLPNDRDGVLISHLEFGKRTPSVSRMNVNSGRLRLENAAIDGVERWHVDVAGMLRAAEAFHRTPHGRRYTLLVRPDTESEFAPVYESDDDAKNGFRFAGFHEDPSRLYVIADHAGRGALYEFDLETRKLGPLVFAHSEVDVAAAQFDEARKKIVGARYLADEPGVEFFDDDARKEQAAIDRALAKVRPGKTINRIVSTTSDGTLVILEASSDVQPPVYYAYNRSKKEMNFIFDQRPEISADQLAKVERIDFEARDGARIPGYVTFPQDREPEKLPMIVLPHAGGGGRDAKVYDPAVQFFANRGFAVLQVNFRGSGGFGREFLRAGRGNAGRTIQDDISDGVKWAILQGFADPDRVGIFGTGYGGYSALMALVLSPDLYRAGASYGAITELEPILRNREMFPWVFEMHGELVDGEQGNRNRLREREPLGRVRDFRAPVLLGHGARDPRVGVEHSRKLAQALRAAGKTVAFYEYEHELHDLALESNRIDFYSRLLEFFETQLSPQKESSEKVQKPTPSSSPDTRSSVPLGDLDSAMSQVLGWDGPC